jgi:hypothetical protein
MFLKYWGLRILYSVVTSARPFPGTLAPLNKGLPVRQPDCLHASTTHFEPKAQLNSRRHCPSKRLASHFCHHSSHFHPGVWGGEHFLPLVAQHKTCDQCKQNPSFAKGLVIGTVPWLVQTQSLICMRGLLWLVQVQFFICIKGCAMIDADTFWLHKQAVQLSL